MQFNNTWAHSCGCCTAPCLLGHATQSAAAHLKCHIHVTEFKVPKIGIVTLILSPESGMVAGFDVYRHTVTCAASTSQIRRPNQASLLAVLTDCGHFQKSSLYCIDASHCFLSANLNHHPLIFLDLSSSYHHRQSVMDSRSRRLPFCLPSSRSSYTSSSAVSSSSLGSSRLYSRETSLNNDHFPRASSAYKADLEQQVGWRLSPLRPS